MTYFQAPNKLYDIIRTYGTMAQSALFHVKDVWGQILTSTVLMVVTDSDPVLFIGKFKFININ